MKHALPLRLASAAAFIIALVVALPGPLATRPADALPLYASREGDVCQTCHVDPNGGGIRNEFGFTYEKNRHSTEPEARWSSMTVNPKLNDWITLGLDVRVLYDAVHVNGGSQTFATATFFPMQGQVNLAVMPHEHLTVVASHGLLVDNSGFSAGYIDREIYGMIEGLPGDTYARVGRFRLPFGLRQDDHTSFTRDRAILPYDSQRPNAGLELGWIRSQTFVQAAVVNDNEPFRSYSETVAAKVGWVGRPFQAAVSGFHRHPKDDLGSAYVSATRGGWTLLGEYVRGSVDMATRRNLEAAFAELVYHPSRAVYIRAKLDYADVYIGKPGWVERRYTGEADWNPVPFVQGKLSYRYLDQEGVRPVQEYLAQIYFPF